MYEFNGVAEPTREGWWWRCGTPSHPVDGGPFRVTQDALTKAWLYWTRVGMQYRCDEYDYVTWTGPIPVPEDKPAKSEVYVREDVPPGVEWPPPSLETSGLRPPAPSEDEETLAETVRKLSGGLDTVSHRPGSSEFAGETFPRKVAEPSAPSEDEEDRAYLKEHPPEKGSYRPLDKVVAEIGEGEKWGKLLHELDAKEWQNPDPWRRSRNKKSWIAVARLFRDECIAPYEAFARIVANIIGMSSPSTACEDIAAIRKAYTDLPFPDQAEATKDKPRLSDEELGYSLQRWLLDEGLAEIALTAEEAGWFGAAIRARLERK